MQSDLGGSSRSQGGSLPLGNRTATSAASGSRSIAGSSQSGRSTTNTSKGVPQAMTYEQKRAVLRMRKQQQFEDTLKKIEQSIKEEEVCRLSFS